MKNTKIILGFLCMSLALNAASPRNVQDFVTDNAPSIACIILAFIGGGMYGEYKNKKKHALEAMKANNELIKWCKAHNVPTTPEEAQKKQEAERKKDEKRQKFMNDNFCDIFQHKVINYFMDNMNNLEVDADGIPVVLHAELPRYKQIVGEAAFTAYSNRIKNCLTDILKIKVRA